MRIGVKIIGKGSVGSDEAAQIRHDGAAGQRIFCDVPILFQYINDMATYRDRSASFVAVQERTYEDQYHEKDPDTDHPMDMRMSIAYFLANPLHCRFFTHTL